VWKLPEGARRTPSLRGGLKGTAPFHWGGELSNMDTLMSEVMAHRMGGLNQSPARVAALEDWLEAQPALPAPSWLDARAVARGKALFEGAAECSTCHAGALGTNNATLEVGTGEALQVPRLVELARRAPYFHDGRIPTLAARFTPAGGGNRHGKVENLSSAEIDDLVAYLASR
jgi:mono/diheme cytochrome c family protein